MIRTVQITACQIRHQLKQSSRIAPDPLHCAQLVKGGVKYSVKGPKPGNQTMCQFICITLGHSVKQQKLEHGMRLEMVKSFPQEAIFQALTVPFMQIFHCVTTFLDVSTPLYPQRAQFSTIQPTSSLAAMITSW